MDPWVITIAVAGPNPGARINAPGDRRPSAEVEVGEPEPPRPMGSRERAELRRAEQARREGRT